MTWQVQNIVRNRCEVKELAIEGIHFNKTIHIQDDYVRRPIEVEIDHLLPNTLYYFRVYVLNTAGWSAPTVVAMHTLDYGPDKAAEKNEH